MPVAWTHTVIRVKQVQTCSSILTRIAVARHLLDHLEEKWEECQGQKPELWSILQKISLTCLTNSSEVTLFSSVDICKAWKWICLAPVHSASTFCQAIWLKLWVWSDCIKIIHKKKIDYNQITGAVSKKKKSNVLPWYRAGLVCWRCWGELHLRETWYHECLLCWFWSQIRQLIDR